MKIQLLKRFYSVAVAFLMAFAACYTFTYAAEESASRPNVVLIMTDDIGFEALQCYGGKTYKTPNLDRLAKSGMRFTNCHATPLCTPSRVRIMTGKYSYRNFTRFAYLDADETTFGDVLKGQGYATCVAGKWQLSNGPNAKLPQEYGFDEYCLFYLQKNLKAAGSRYADPTLSINSPEQKKYVGKYGPDIINDFVCDFIEKNQKKPFFVYYPMVLAHNPFDPTPDSDGGIYAKDPTNSPIWKESANKETPKLVTASDFEQQNFEDMVAYSDKMVGKVLDKLNKLNLQEQTLVIFTSDNGSHPGTRSIIDGKKWRGGKGRVHEFGTHVPLIAYWPGKIQGNRVCEDLIDFTDVFPTIAQTANVPPSAIADLDGVSFLPQLNAENGTPRSHLFLHYDPDHGKPGSLWATPLTRYVLTKKWKLYNDGRLYDIVKDRTEMHPVPPESFPETREKLQKLLDAKPPISEASTPSVARRKGK